MKKLSLVLASFLCAIISLPTPATETADNPRVRLTINLGVIELELNAKQAPITVQNFIKYTDAGFYNGAIFHRVIPGFMIQGGGFAPGMKEKPTNPPIQNEASNGLKNLAGTVAMARKPDPHSASAQFFINTVDNSGLDHRDKSTSGWGYCVFGRVTKGMDVVKKIEKVPTRNAGMFQDVPVKDVVIQKVELIK